MNETKNYVHTRLKRKIFSLMIGFFFCSFMLFSKDNSSLAKPSPLEIDNLLEQYVTSLGARVIVFDPSNIKQYWIDSSVLKKDDTFEISLRESINGFTSNLLPIKLIHVDESQDCHVEIIAETKDFSFEIVDAKKKSISEPLSVKSFLLSTSCSTSFHLEDTADLSFYIKFESPVASSLSIRKIIVSFSKNAKSSFLASPGKYDMIKDTLSVNAKSRIKNDTDSLVLSGYQMEAFATTKILTQGAKGLTCSVRIKNIGDEATRIYVGFRPYLQNRVYLRPNHYLTSGYDAILSVISSEDNSSSIITDHYEEDVTGFYFAIEAKEDLSDIPNLNLTEGYVKEIKQIDDKKTEFILSKPNTKGLASGTKIRPQKSGGFFYANVKVLQPGEEFVWSDTIKQDPDSVYYSQNGIPKGVYYVCPIIFSYSISPEQLNTILVSEYTVSF